MDDEKRKAVRVKVTLFVQYCFTDENGEKKWDIATVKDISETGVSIQTGKYFPVTGDISLRFKIPSRPFDQTEATGRVVECTDIGHDTYRTRVEFSAMDEDTKLLFHEYVEWVVKNKK